MSFERPLTMPVPVPLSARSPERGPQKIDVANLFAGKREVVIVHRGEEYRLRITRQEKLILTK